MAVGEAIFAGSCSGVYIALSVDYCTGDALFCRFFCRMQMLSSLAIAGLRALLNQTLTVFAALACRLAMDA
jgi:hypothetical protein